MIMKMEAGELLDILGDMNATIPQELIDAYPAWPVEVDIPENEMTMGSFKVSFKFLPISVGTLAE